MSGETLNTETQTTAWDELKNFAKEARGTEELYSRESGQSNTTEKEEKTDIDIKDILEFKNAIDGAIDDYCESEKQMKFGEYYSSMPHGMSGFFDRLVFPVKCGDVLMDNLATLDSEKDGARQMLLPLLVSMNIYKNVELPDHAPNAHNGENAEGTTLGRIVNFVKREPGAMKAIFESPSYILVENMLQTRESVKRGNYKIPRVHIDAHVGAKEEYGLDTMQEVDRYSEEVKEIMRQPGPFGITYFEDARDSALYKAVDELMTEYEYPSIKQQENTNLAIKR